MLRYYIRFIVQCEGGQRQVTPSISRLVSLVVPNIVVRGIRWSTSSPVAKRDTSPINAARVRETRTRQSLGPNTTLNYSILALYGLRLQVTYGAHLRLLRSSQYLTAGGETDGATPVPAVFSTS